MPVMNMIQALNSAMDVMLARDSNVVIFGEDIGYFGGVFRATEGLQKKYGLDRIFDAPIAEGGIMAAAVGMAAYGLRPVVEIQFADYIYPATDQLVSEAARLRYRSGGEFTAPLTVRSPYGGGIFGGSEDCDSIQSIRCERATDRRD
jgi:2-oxoisovalerate dehydrogenase E1 component subunit beta